MAIKFTPKKEEELNKFDPLPEGIYPFTTLESGEIPSKSEKNKGRMMCAVKLNVHGPSFDRHVYGYFSDWFSEWLLKHYCETTGQGAAYESGVVDSDNNAWQGKTGWVQVGIEEYQGKKKNVIQDFIVKKEATAPPKSETPESDDPPF